MLQVASVHKSFGGIKAVDGASFSVREGSITALIGPNGAGKTTLFGIIMGFIAPDRGNISFSGRRITMLPPHRRFLLGMATTFQRIRLFPGMTVMDNVLIAMCDRNEEVLHAILKTASMRRFEHQLRADAMQWLSFVGLEAKEHELAQDLSFGQQKLLEIARAVAARPRLLLLDEPASGVNPVMLEKIRLIMKKLNRQGTTILFIEHNMEFVMGIAQSIVVLDHGREIAHGPPQRIRRNPKVIDAYLGTVC